jgi:hypothetical protein
MRKLTTSVAAFGAALLLGLAGASPSLAKGHDQGMNGSDSRESRAGGNDASSTVNAAQGLGDKRGNSENTPAAENSNRSDK